jgi:hypothetical protein
VSTIALSQRLFGNACFTGAVLIGFEQIFASFVAYIIAGMFFLIVLLLHVLYYRHSLGKQSGEEIIHEQAVEMGISLPTIKK